MRVFLFMMMLFVSAGVFAVPAPSDVNIVSPNPLPVSITSALPVSFSFPTPLPVYITAANPAVDIEPGTFSQFLSQVTLGDLWLLQFVVGICQLAFLGAIHGHQR